LKKTVLSKYFDGSLKDAMVLIVVFALLRNDTPPNWETIMNECSFILLVKYEHVKDFL
jgi:hypothetical protein